jgi:hypothetical protein
MSTEDPPATEEAIDTAQGLALLSAPEGATSWRLRKFVNNVWTFQSHSTRAKDGEVAIAINQWPTSQFRLEGLHEFILKRWGAGRYQVQWMTEENGIRQNGRRSPEFTVAPPPKVAPPPSLKPSTRSDPRRARAEELLRELNEVAPELVERLATPAAPAPSPIAGAVGLLQAMQGGGVSPAIAQGTDPMSQTIMLLGAIMGLSETMSKNRIAETEARAALDSQRSQQFYEVLLKARTDAMKQASESSPREIADLREEMRELFEELAEKGEEKAKQTEDRVVQILERVMPVLAPIAERFLTPAAAPKLTG